MAGRRKSENPAQARLLFDWDTPLVETEPPFFDRPSCDNEVLMNAQHDYLMSGHKDRRAWLKLWTVSLRVATKMTRKRAKAEGRFLCEDDLHDRAQDAAFYLLNRYEYVRQRTGHEYVIRTSFISAIYHAVQHSMDYADKADLMTDYVDVEFFDTYIDERDYTDEKEAMRMAGMPKAL